MNSSRKDENISLFILGSRIRVFPRSPKSKARQFLSTYLLRQRLQVGVANSCPASVRIGCSSLSVFAPDLPAANVRAMARVDTKTRSPDRKIGASEAPRGRGGRRRRRSARGSDRRRRRCHGYRTHTQASKRVALCSRSFFASSSVSKVMSSPSRSFT